MKSVTGIFASCSDAEKAISSLRSNGVEESQITLLLPGTPEEEAREAATVPTSDTEQPGMGKAMGGVVGVAMGAAGGLSLGSVAASALIPGVGPVIGLGIARWMTRLAAATCESSDSRPVDSAGMAKISLGTRKSSHKADRSDQARC